ncbi:MAG: C10 family peptidase [Bacteroidaceae bacterium]|jgi:hypothetical protein
MKANLLRCLSAGMFLLCTCAFADKVSITTARYTAMQFFSQHGDTRSGAFIRKSLQQETLLDDSTYLFINGNGNFVLVSGRDDLPPILGYGEYHDAEPHEGLQKLAKMMGNGKYLFQQELSTTPILPLLKTIRSQNDPFNGSCPYYMDEGKQVDTKRCKVGCVATALEEILTYYQYPQELKDTLWGWKTAHYTVDTIPKGTKLDFDQILNVYEAGHYTDKEAHAVANLCYYCGIAAKMNWGLSSSGADGEQLVTPLKKVFGYKYVRHLYATNYTPQRWRELIDKELKAGRPIWFAGYTYFIGGHAFVIDGKDSNGFYHIHWGYGGNYDGYYDLSVLNTFENPSRPTETGKWMGNYCDQEVLLLHPDSVEWTGGDTISLKDNLKIDSVRYLRKPDGNAYVTIKIYAKNISEEPINAAVEMLTYMPGDTAIFKNADYVGMSGSDIAPHVSVCLTAYCHFTESGERIFGITADGKNFIYKDTLQIQPRNEYGVTIVDVDTIMKGTEAVFYVRINNNSGTAWAGDILTYSLFEGDYTTAEGDWRQWHVLNLPPETMITDTISFGTLKTNTKYTFVVRNPWLPSFSMSFNTAEVTAIQAIKSENKENMIYKLDGLPVDKLKRGSIYLQVKNGHYIKVYYQK